MPVINGLYWKGQDATTNTRMLGQNADIIVWRTVGTLETKV